MKKQTAVEWIEETIDKRHMGAFLKSLIENAKQMEKQQIEDAYNEGRKAGIGDYVDIEWGRNVTELTAEQYYNETFKSE